MACAASSFRLTKAVSTDGTATPRFVVFARYRVDDWTDARVSLLVESSTANLTTETTGRYANEEGDFPSATLVDLGYALHQQA